MDARVLLIEEDGAQREEIIQWLSAEGYEVLSADPGADTERYLDRGISVIISGLPFQRLGGRELMRTAAKVAPGAQLILMGSQDRPDEETAALRSGVFEVLARPIRPQRFLHFVGKAARMAEMSALVNRAKQEREERHSLARLPFLTTGSDEVCETIRRVADTRVPVLIEGESGTGKEVVARSLHQNSRRPGPFVPIHGEVIPEGLLEGELFGEAGEGDESIVGREGKLVQARRGTLFLEELTGLSLDLQGKLLRLVETGKMTPVGSVEEVAVDVRLIGSSSRGLEDAVKEGRFRRDLFLAFSAIRIELPPLRERKDAIPLIVRTILERLCQENGRVLRGVTREALDLMCRFEWPGNLRELRACLEGAILLSDRDVLGVEDLPSVVRESAPTRQDAGSSLTDLAGLTMAEIERAAIEQTLFITEGNRTRSARILGIGLRTLHRKMIQYGLR